MKTEFSKLSICFSCHLYITDARFILDTVLSLFVLHFIYRKKDDNICIIKTRKRKKEKIVYSSFIFVVIEPARCSIYRRSFHRTMISYIINV